MPALKLLLIGCPEPPRVPVVLNLVLLISVSDVLAQNLLGLELGCFHVDRGGNPEEGLVAGSLRSLRNSIAL